MAVFTPTTSPSTLKVGPPELPLLIGASICRNRSYGPSPMSRPFAEMMPGGHGAAETIRIADRDDPVADLGHSLATTKG